MQKKRVENVFREKGRNLRGDLNRGKGKKTLKTFYPPKLFLSTLSNRAKAMPYKNINEYHAVI